MLVEDGGVCSGTAAVESFYFLRVWFSYLALPTALVTLCLTLPAFNESTRASSTLLFAVKNFKPPWLQTAITVGLLTFYLFFK